MSLPDETVMAYVDGELDDAAGDGVADLSATRATRQAEAAAKQSRQIAARRWSLPQFGAIAASLVIGVLLGQGLFRSSQEKVVSSDGSMVAGGALDDALTR